MNSCSKRVRLIAVVAVSCGITSSGAVLVAMQTGNDEGGRI